MTTGDVKGALQGAFTAGMFYGAGSLIKANAAVFGRVEQIALHGVVGCVTSVSGGGKCGPGALSASFSKAVAPAVSNMTGNNAFAGAMASAVVGGTGSVLGGGKFSNGATSGAFGYLFNHCRSVEGGCWNALKDAAGMTADWATGMGGDTRVFGPGSIQVTDMMDAPGVNSARDFFYNKNAAALASGSYESLQPVTNYGAGFGLIDLFTTTSPTQQFVGSYRIDILPMNNGADLMFMLNNNSSFKSFAYGILPAWERGTSQLPAGNMRQTYWWIEPRRKK